MAVCRCSASRATIEPSLAGPKRPQDRVPLRTSKAVYRGALAKMVEERTQKNPAATGKAPVTSGGKSFELADGAVMIAGNYFGSAGLASFHDFEETVPQEVKDKLDEIRAGFVDGSVTTGYQP